MDWKGNGNGNGTVAFVSGPAESSFSFLFNYDLHYSVPIPEGTQMMHPMMTVQTQEGLETVQIMEMNNFANNSNNNVEEKRKNKKKKLTSEQLESLESSFQEEIKLEPDRKMKLAQELGIDPRQVAVWFQNRRARWKTKQLEHSYHSLKHQFHLVSKENQMLQHEVRGLRAVLNEEATKKQVDIYGESTHRPWGTASNNQNRGDHQHNFVFNVHDNNQGRMMPYWGVMPSYP